MRRLFSWEAWNQRRTWAYATLIIGILYVGLRLSPSSYSLALESAGLGRKGLVIGKPRPIRSDEWAVATPLLQIAVRSGLREFDEISRYHETLLVNYVLPIRHWSTLFRPEVWGFFVLPPDFAFSLEWFLIAAVMFWGMALLLAYLCPGAAFGLIGVMSFGFVFTAYVQVWLSTIGPVIMSWPLMTWLLLNEKIPWRWRAPGFAMSLAAMLGGTYPPAAISILFASLVLWLATRSPRRWIPEGAAFGAMSAIIAALWYLAFRDYIQVIQTTAYPGARTVAGGGVPWQIALTHFIPGLFVSRFEGTEFNNICENSTVSCCAAFAAVGFLRLDGVPRKLLLFSIAGLLLMGAWIWAPVPEAWGKLLLWNKVPPVRMLAGFGVLFYVLGVCWILKASVASRYWPWAILAFLAMVELGPADGWHSFARKEVFVQGLFLLGLFLVGRRLTGEAVRNAVVLGGLAPQVLMFFYFNPVQRTGPIFADHSNEGYVAEFRKLAAQDPTGFYRGPGLACGVLDGLGVPTLATVLATPQEPFFRLLYPDMPQEQFHNIFGRYARVWIDPFGNAPEVPSPDTIFLPEEDLISDRASRLMVEYGRQHGTK